MYVKVSTSTLALAAVMVNAQQLLASEVVKAIPNLGFYQAANLAVEHGHDQWTPSADANVKPIPNDSFGAGS